MQATPVKLIVGLGNPGDKYDKTRHNAGFLFLDELCRQYQGVLSKDKNCFGRSAKLSIDGHTVRVLAPDTFMNLSGKAVVACLSYYKIALNEALVVHDELDLPPGAAKLKLAGGHGGHNGLRDIIAKTGSNDFARLRLGIGHPGSAAAVSGYVLRPAPQAEQLELDRAIVESLHVVPALVAGDFQAAMQQLHTN